MAKGMSFRLVVLMMIIMLMISSRIVILSEACSHQRANNGCKDCVSEQMKYTCPSCVPILRCAARCLWSGSSQAKCVMKCDCGGGKPRLLDCRKCMVRCKCSCS
ncbi:hypothetical protein Sjap_025123 [Stephania japonica]|uniref:Uncharacterized protein n=1 Tax=Stephania japonica TaxID=461633 RepID=A0AAP0E4L5_9MAGN